MNICSTRTSYCQVYRCMSVCEHLFVCEQFMLYKCGGAVNLGTVGATIDCSSDTQFNSEPFLEVKIEQISQCASYGKIGR